VEVKEHATEQPVGQNRNNKKKKEIYTWIQMKIEIQQFKSVGCSKSCFKREVYSNTGLPQDTTSNTQSNSTPKTHRKRRTL